MLLLGVVRNIVAFGAFVDVGVDTDGALFSLHLCFVFGYVYMLCLYMHNASMLFIFTIRKKAQPLQNNEQKNKRCVKGYFVPKLMP